MCCAVDACASRRRTLLRLAGIAYMRAWLWLYKRSHTSGCGGAEMVPLAVCHRSCCLFSPAVVSWPLGSPFWVLGGWLRRTVCASTMCGVWCEGSGFVRGLEGPPSLYCVQGLVQPWLSLLSACMSSRRVCSLILCFRVNSSAAVRCVSFGTVTLATCSSFCRTVPCTLGINSSVVCAVMHSCLLEAWLASMCNGRLLESGAHRLHK